MIIDLQTKIKQKGLWKNSELSAIKLRVPTAGDIVGLDFSPPTMQAALVELVARLSGLPVQTILSIELSDWMKIVTRVTDMINGKPQA